VKLDQGLDEKLSIHGGNSMTVDLDAGDNKIINLGPPPTKDNAASKEYVDTEISKVGGSNKMAADFDMNNKKIINLSTDSHNMLSATNIRYVNQVKSDMIITLTDSFSKKINEAHISGSTD